MLRHQLEKVIMRSSMPKLICLLFKPNILWSITFSEYKHFIKFNASKDEITSDGEMSMDCHFKRMQN